MLTPYGRNVWLPIVVIGVILGGACVAMQWWIALGAIIIVMLALLSFFRDPPRRVPAGLASGEMLCPADGTVSAVFDVDQHEALDHRPARVIRIFLSVLNVHVNRAPCDGEVISITPRPGRYLNAQTEESALVNESNMIVLRAAPAGVPELIGVRQVSGMIARTIVCPLKPGDRLTRGQKFGMIKFGSTTELILPRPADVTVHVRKGDKVRAGVMIIATLKPPSASTSAVVSDRAAG
jgi:phosphatidylserine decarboxylase